MKKADLHICKSPEELAVQFADLMMNWVEQHTESTFNLAISGGKTPDLLFLVLASKYADSLLWLKVHFWWVDERMVPPDHPESNFGIANKLLFSQIPISEKNIHRIKGENDPVSEALSYSTQIINHVNQSNKWPVFDLILLGMGDDGHTASIFPNQLDLLKSDQICEVAIHPESGQKRVTLTGNAINNASKICFLITGKSKAERIYEIIYKTEDTEKLPAFFINPTNGEITWHLDMEASEMI